jgi:hypothetical protein
LWVLSDTSLNRSDPSSREALSVTVKLR